MKDLGQKMQNAREAKGYTQAALGSALGISSRMVQRYEEGVFPKFKSENIKHIDKLLGTTLYESIYDNHVQHGTKATKANINSTVESEISKMREMLIRQEASVNVLTVTLAEVLAKTTKRSIGSISVELSKAIDGEADRLFAELKKK